MKTLDMRVIRYLNLFNKITKVRTKNCFLYNNTVIFSVDKNKVSKAIGKEGINVKKISEIIKKKIKVIMLPKDINDAEKFISEIISPFSFKSLEIKDNQITINAGRQSKAALIGRGKARLKEMQDIIKQYFGKELKVV